MPTIEIQSHLPYDFSPTSRVWIYQSSRLFFLSEVFEIEEMLKQFTDNWQSHGSPVKGYANLFFGLFIIIMADETATGVSGCSTDSSVRIIKEMEKKFGVSMFNRESLAFHIKEKVQQIPMSQLEYALSNGFINPDTIYFNNLVQTKKELEEKWMIPLEESWLKGKMLQG